MHRYFRYLSLLACSAGILPIAAEASAFDAAAIPGDAQWLLHLDAEQFRGTRIGQAFIAELSERAAADNASSMSINPALLINGLRGLTLYGSGLDLNGGNDGVGGGVAYLSGTPQLIQIVQGMIAGIELEAPERIRLIENTDHEIYQIDGEIFGTILDGERIVLGKSMAGLQGFLNTQRRPQSTADISGRFRGYAPGEGRFFLSAFADGINQASGLPVQARVLQLTEGASFQLGEASGRLQLNVALATDSERTAQQVRQVLQGIVALLSLTQSNDPDLEMLTRSVAFSIDDQTVRFNLSYPIDSAQRWVTRLAEMGESAIESAAPSPDAPPAH